MTLENLSYKYNIYKANGVWYINFGTIKKNEHQTIEVQFNDVDTKAFSINVTCGCSSADGKVVNENTYRSTIKFNGSSLPKTIILREKNKQTELKLIGEIIK